MVNANNLKKQAAAFFRSLIKLQTKKQYHTPYKNREKVLVIEILL